MIHSVQVITPDRLFRSAKIAAFGKVEWKEEVPEHGPGVYVITSTEPPVAGQTVVYIGRSKHLSKRLHQFYKHKHGQRAPHRGGQDILTLGGRLTVYWAATDDYAAAERTMLNEFSSVVGKWPFGNRMKSAAMAAASR